MDGSRFFFQEAIQGRIIEIWWSREAVAEGFAILGPISVVFADPTGFSGNDSILCPHCPPISVFTILGVT